MHTYRHGSLESAKSAIIITISWGVRCCVLFSAVPGLYVYIWRKISLVVSRHVSTGDMWGGRVEMLQLCIWFWYGFVRVMRAIWQRCLSYVCNSVCIFPANSWGGNRKGTATCRLQDFCFFLAFSLWLSFIRRTIIFFPIRRALGSVFRCLSQLFSP